VNLENLKAYRFAPVEHAYTKRDTMLYALGLGYGSDPMSPRELPFVYEDGLKAVPTQCVVLGHPGFWAKAPELAIDWVKLLHGEHFFEMHRPLPVEGKVRAEHVFEAVDDKGSDKGAIIYVTKRLFDSATNALIATVRTVGFLRGDGGCGSHGTPPAPPSPLPEGRPDAAAEIRTLPQQALIYRLSGDYNPIHADPVPARKAGFERPILHGLCTMGVASRALIDMLTPGEPERLTSMFVRFSRPVYPGETIVTECFGKGLDVRFRCLVKERNVVVLDRGSATIAA
jgi:acyl dehydratase